MKICYKGNFKIYLTIVDPNFKIESYKRIL